MATQEQYRTPSLGLEHILSQVTLLHFAEMHLPNSPTQTWGPASLLQKQASKSQPASLLQMDFSGEGSNLPQPKSRKKNISDETISLISLQTTPQEEMAAQARVASKHVFSSSIIGNAVKNIKPLCCNKSLQLWGLLHPHRLRFLPQHGANETCRKGVGHITPHQGSASWVAEAVREDLAQLSEYASQHYSPGAQQCVFLLALGADENLGAVEGISGPPNHSPLPFTPAKEHCTSGVLHCAPRALLQEKK